MENKLKIGLLTSFTLLSACATYTPPAIANQIALSQIDAQNVIAARQATTSTAQNTDFDCDKLIENYDASMAAFQPAPQEKKSLLSRLGSSALSSAGAIGTTALLGGADLGTVNAAVTSANIINGAQERENGLEKFQSGQSLVAVTRQSYNLGLANGCDMKAMQDITKKYGEK